MENKILMQIDELLSSDISLIDVIEFSEDNYKAMIKKIDEVIPLINHNSSNYKEIEKLCQLVIIKADLYKRITDYSNSLKYFELALKLISNSPHDTYLTKLKALYGIAWNNARMGNYQKGLNYCDTLINYAISQKQLIGAFFTVRGACNRELGNYNAAERDFSIGDNPNLVLKIEQKGDENIF